MRNGRVISILVIALIFLSIISSCEKEKKSGQTHELLNAVLWMQHSAEYESLTLQAYNSARNMLDLAIKDVDWTAALEQKNDYQHLPSAVILDIDETVLDNLAYESYLICNQGSYTKETWDRWCNEKRASAIPGALEFCQYAHEKGITIFYITNRRDHLKEVTRENLKATGFPLNENHETLLTRTDSADKGSRRQMVANNYRILLLIGDNNGDFTSGFTRNSTSERQKLVDQYKTYWGSKWIVLPNPAYGDWEGALFNYDNTLPDSHKLHIKYQALGK